MQVELKPLVANVSTAIGMRQQTEAVDAVMVNGVLSGYIEHGPGKKVFGLRPNIPQDAWPEIVAAVKVLRPDMDDSEWSGVSAAAVALAMQDDDYDEDEGEEETEVDDVGE